METDEFLGLVYSLFQQNKTDRALDVIFRWINDELATGGVGVFRCNQMLRQIDVSLYDEDILVGFLTASYAGKMLLHERTPFAARVTKLLSETARAEDTEWLEEII